MKLIFDGSSFIALCAFSEKEIPKQSGFLWNTFLKRWETRSPVIAVRLRQYADENARKKIDRLFLSSSPWPHGIQTTSVNKNLTLKPYQERAVRFALEQNKTYLALDPGLGKTAIAATIRRHFPKHFAAYICPPFLENTVKNEFKTWCDKNLHTYIFPDTKIHRPSVLEFIKDMTEVRSSILFIDEAHRFKEDTSRRTEYLFNHIVPLFDRVVYLSGTPMPNRPIELYSILNASASEVIDFKTKQEFGVRYCAGFVETLRFGFREKRVWNFKGASNVEELGAKIKERFMLRIRKEEVLPELPPKTEGLIVLGDKLPLKIAKLEKYVLNNLGEEDLVREEVTDSEYLATYRRELGKYKVDDALPVIRDILLETDDCLLIFAIHKEVVALLSEGLKDYKHIIITGDTPAHKRHELVDDFQKNDSIRFVLGNIDACGIGYTMTKASRVLFVEFAYTPGANDQAADRTHRIGQHKNVLVQYFVFGNSLDMRVLEINLRKKASIQHV